MRSSANSTVICPKKKVRHEALFRGSPSSRSVLHQLCPGWTISSTCRSRAISAAGSETTMRAALLSLPARTPIRSNFGVLRCALRSGNLAAGIDERIARRIGALHSLTLAKESVDLEELQRENSLQMRHLESEQRKRRQLVCAWLAPSMSSISYTAPTGTTLLIDLVAISLLGCARLLRRILCFAPCVL
jgi:hypothetical protein